MHKKLSNDYAQIIILLCIYMTKSYTYCYPVIIINWVYFIFLTLQNAKSNLKRLAKSPRNWERIFWVGNYHRSCEYKNKWLEVGLMGYSCWIIGYSSLSPTPLINPSFISRGHLSFSIHFGKYLKETHKTKGN